MPTPTSIELQKLLDEFAKQPGVTAEVAANLKTTIANSPTLAAQVDDAIAKGHLKSFKPLTDAHAGGAYNGKEQAMLLPINGLTKPPAGSYNAGNMTFVLGHEVQHGFYRTDRDTALKTFATEATALAKTVADKHDYTATIGKVIQADRDNEAKAHIAGWNALVGSVREAKPTATLADVYNASPGRAGDFMTRGGTAPNFTYALKADLTVDAKLSMAMSADNVKAMGKYYFDMPPAQARLGHNGNSDYANYYGAGYISYVSQLEHAHGKTASGGKPELHVNMTQLKLNENIMEQNGIDLGANSANRQSYFDTSATPPKAGHFDHTKSTHTHVNINASPLDLLNELRGDPHAHGPGDPRHAEHPDHALFRGILDKVNGEFSKHGSSVSERDADRIAAGLTLESKRNQLTPDHVVLSVDPATKEVGKTAFLVQGDPASPTHTRVGMATDRAAPAEESFRQLEALNQAQAPAQPAAQGQQQTASRTAPAL